MKLFTKGLILIAFALILGVSLYRYSYINTEKYLNKNLNITQDFLLLQLDISKLKLEILKSSLFLYYNNDRINFLKKDIGSILDKIKKSLISFGDENKHVFTRVQALENSFELYKKKIQKYITLNSSIKNFTMNVPLIQLKSSEFFKDDPKVTLLLMKIYDDIFIAKNTMDSTSIESLKSKIDKLNEIKKGYSKESNEFKFLTTLNKYITYFIFDIPNYNEILNNLLNNSFDKEIGDNLEAFQKDLNAEVSIVNKNIIVLLILYIISLLIILFFIYRMNLENKTLKNLKEHSDKLLLMDSLTGLRGMRAFNLDIVKFRHPSLILINIDRFKHINEFYGTRMGDVLLIKVAQMLKLISPKGFKVYRLGGDDFGILFENYDKDVGLKKWVDFYIKHTENYVCRIDGISIEPRFSLGASSNRNRIFETADMALRVAKNISRHKYMIYTKNIDKMEEIKNNIATISNISSALKENRLKAYYQPVFNIKADKIEKYEALARIELKDGTLLKPCDFMDPAIEAKLRGDITISILKQIIKVARESKYKFSVNVSSGDIQFYKDREAIMELLKENIDIAHKIIFEILESEEIDDYEIVNDFIKNIKSFGCMVAIDDFGSGYSNFEKILNLDIDIIKVDGSLIKNIDKDEHSKLIIKTILGFAKYAKFTTIAEFVYSESVYKEVKELNFHYAQGYYIGEPSPNIN